MQLAKVVVFNLIKNQRETKEISIKLIVAISPKHMINLIFARGTSLLKNVVHLLQSPSVFKRNLRKIHENPLTLFLMGEMLQALAFQLETKIFLGITFLQNSLWPCILSEFCCKFICGSCCLPENNSFCLFLSFCGFGRIHLAI